MAKGSKWASTRHIDLEGSDWPVTDIDSEGEGGWAMNGTASDCQPQQSIRCHPP